MPNKLVRFSLAATTALALLSHSATGQTPMPDPQPDPHPTPIASPTPPEYSEGIKAMDEKRWSDALASFDKVAATKGDYADAALYWKAYNLEKLGRKQEANAICDQLAQGRPQSSWNNECIALRVEANIDLSQIKAQAKELAQLNINLNMDQTRLAAEAAREAAEAGNQGKHKVFFKFNDSDGDEPPASRTPHDPNDDLKLLALNSLMQQEPDKALPALRTFIFSDKPIELRRRALFVLGESKTPAAQQLLLEIATKNADPALQRAAVQTLATTQGKDAAPQLLKIYTEASDTRVKRAALNGLFIANDAPSLVSLARSEKDIDLKRDIVSQLALMHDPAATAYMEELLK